MQCALTKLGYLLSKPELSIAEVRELIRTPLRGEMTLPSGSSKKRSLGHNLDKIQNLLGQVIRLSSTSVTPGSPDIVVMSPGLEQKSEDAAAPWSWTAAEAVSTETALLPILIHLAVSQDDVQGLRFCLEHQDRDTATPSLGEKQYRGSAGSIVNCVDAASGRSPLHVAALNGSVLSLHVLLEAGALVHLRDTLGHTALYYVRYDLHGDNTRTDILLI